VGNSQHKETKTAAKQFFSRGGQSTKAKEKGQSGRGK